MSTSPFATHTDVDIKNSQTFREVMNVVSAIGTTDNGKIYNTLAEAIALNPKPANGIRFFVKTANTYYEYKFDSSQADGIKYIGERIFQIDSVETGKNKFNPAEIQQNKIILTDGNIYDNNGFVVSGKIYCTEGIEESLQGMPTSTRRISIRDINGNVIEVIGIADAEYTFTPPENADHYYVCIKRPEDTIDLYAIQFETSPTVTLFEPYQVLLSELNGKKILTENIAVEGKIRESTDFIIKNEDVTFLLNDAKDKWYIRIPFDDEYDLFHVWGLDDNNFTPDFKRVLKLSKNTSNNPLYLDKLQESIHSCGDDTCPIRLYQSGVIDGGHGLKSIKVNLTDHGKTSADLESEWTDGTYNWYLIEIPDNSSLLFIGKSYPFPNGDAVPGSINSNTLTHVSGATNTGSIDATSNSTKELHPSTLNREIKFYVGEKEITSGGVYRGENVRICDNHSVIDPRNVTIQTPFVPNEGGILLNEKIIYKYDKTNNCQVNYSVLDFNVDYFIEEFGVTQSQRFITGYFDGEKTLAYFPNTETVNNGNQDYNFATNPPDIFYPLGGNNVEFGAGNGVEDGRCVNRYIQLQLDSLDQNLHGFAITYPYELSKSKYDERKLLTNQWELRGSSGKSYPNALYNYAATGNILQLIVNRTYYDAALNPNSTAVYCYEENGYYFLFIDYHTSVSKETVKLPKYLKGKQIIEIVESNGDMTLHTESYIPKDGVIISVNTYGYNVLKLK